MNEKTALSTAALISDGRGRWLVARRSAGGQGGGKWEFPGGKVEGEESVRDGLRRELKEELHVDCLVQDEMFSTGFEHRGVHYVLKAFRVELAQAPRGPFEHQEFAWLDPAGIAELDLVPSDRRILEHLLALSILK